jgi:RNA recognition motif-containing protein
VEFELPSDAADALENMNESELFGKVLHCNLAKPTQISKNKPGTPPFTCSSSPLREIYPYILRSDNFPTLLALVAQVVAKPKFDLNTRSTIFCDAVCVQTAIFSKISKFYILKFRILEFTFSNFYIITCGNRFI